MSVTNILPPRGGWVSPWPQVFELARALEPESWVLVGGLMVQAHVMQAGLTVSRVTEDVDLLARVETIAGGYASLASRLGNLGYEFDDQPRFAYRFRRNAEIVDLMAPDHARPALRFRQRNVFPVAAGTQALSRAFLATFATSESEVGVPLPSLKAAIILKAAAASTDGRDRDRHLLDSITLLACVTDVDTILTDRKGSDTKRLTNMVRGLREREILFSQVPDDTAELAIVMLSELERTLPQRQLKTNFRDDLDCRHRFVIHPEI